MRIEIDVKMKTLKTFKLKFTDISQNFRTVFVFISSADFLKQREMFVMPWPHEVKWKKNANFTLNRLCVKTRDLCVEM